MSIQQYSLTYGAMANMSTGDLTLEHEAEDETWCRYSDVEPLEERITKLEAANESLIGQRAVMRRRIEALVKMLPKGRREPK